MRKIKEKKNKTKSNIYNSNIMYIYIYPILKYDYNILEPFTIFYLVTWSCDCDYDRYNISYFCYTLWYCDYYM